MFSLIITIISIALVALLALATLYYGGDAFNEGRADAKAAQILSHGQQLMAAADLYFVNHGVFPPNTQAMIDGGYLKSVPIAQGGAVDTAWAVNEEWVMPKPGVPVFVLPDTDPRPCQRVNFRSYHMDGILAEVNESIAAQCYGPTDDFKTVVSKGGSHLANLRNDALNSDPDVTVVTPVDFGDLETDLPDPEASDGTWTAMPGTIVAPGLGGGGPGPGPGPDPDAPFGWCGDPELGTYPCPDPNAPVQPQYCVGGTLASGESSCADYYNTWVSGYSTATFNRVKYTATVSDTGVVTGLPYDRGNLIGIAWKASADVAGTEILYGGRSYNSSTGVLSENNTFANPLSSYTSGVFELTQAYGNGESGVAWRYDDYTYPMYSAGTGVYDAVRTIVRWPANGASSLQFCVEYDSGETPAQAASTVSGFPTMTGITAGACN